MGTQQDNTKNRISHAGSKTQNQEDTRNEQGGGSEAAMLSLVDCVLAASHLCRHPVRFDIGVSKNRIPNNRALIRLRPTAKTPIHRSSHIAGAAEQLIDWGGQPMAPSEFTSAIMDLAMCFLFGFVMIFFGLGYLFWNPKENYTGKSR